MRWVCMSLIRSRWAAIGAAVAVSLGAGGGLGWYAHAADSATSSFVSITPCRLFDTRASDNVGDRATPLGTGETFSRPVWGTNGACIIPSTATGIAYNLTVPNPTVSGFIKLFPGDTVAPNASAINPVAGAGTKANSGIVGLSSTGGIMFFIQVGPIDALLDITGYFLPASAGPAGPVGVRGFSAWDTIPAGQTVTGGFALSATYESGSNFVSISLPANAPVVLSDANVNFSPSAAPTTDNDVTCTGSFAAPTAPAGKVCLYLAGSPSSTVSGLNGASGRPASQTFWVLWTQSVPGRVALSLTWAYTAP